MKNLFILIIATLLLNGCGKDSTQADQLISKAEPLSISIAGDYTDPYNSSHSINSETWVVSFNDNSSTYEILEFNNEEQRLVALNGADSYNPGEYSVFEWVVINGTIYYCQSVYNAETLEDAESAEKSNSLDPANGGCGDYNFPWTELQ